MSLTPSAELLKRHNNRDVDWNDFKTALLSELRDSMDSAESIYTLHAKSIMQDMTLLCYEKDGCPCHRHMVRDLIEDPRLLDDNLTPENTDDHKPAPMQVHVDSKKNLAVS